MYSYYRSASRFVTIDKGKYIQDVNAASIAGYYDFDVTHYLAFQLYEDSGKPATSSYRGPGQVLERGSKKYLLLGDPYRDTQLPEYLIDSSPTSESDRNLDEFIAGFKAGMEGKRKTKGGAWADGHSEAKPLRKKLADTSWEVVVRTQLKTLFPNQLLKVESGGLGLWIELVKADISDTIVGRASNEGVRIVIAGPNWPAMCEARFDKGFQSRRNPTSVKFRRMSGTPEQVIPKVLQWFKANRSDLSWTP